MMISGLREVMLHEANLACLVWGKEKAGMAGSSLGPVPTTNEEGV